MTYIYNVGNKKLVAVEIVEAKGKMPVRKDGWLFDWNRLNKERNTRTYVLKLKDQPKDIEGAIQLRIKNEMLIMEVLEIAPHNIGSEDRKYDFVAGSLIAFACRESFKLESPYKGFLTFTSKTSLIEWYIEKYGATQALGQRMYIGDEAGLKLIEKYLD